MPMLTQKQQIAIKQEATAGVTETVTAADVVLKTGNAEFEADVAMTPREALSASLSKRGSVVGSRMGKIRWSQYLRGTSTAPVASSNEPDFSVPFKGCGAAITVSGGSPNEQSSFKPSTSTISDETNGAYCTVALYEDGKRYMLRGAVGNCVLTHASGLPPKAAFEFTGVLVPPPTDTALLVPTYPTIVEPPFLTAAISILGYTTARIQTLTLDFGNQIVMRPDPNNPQGYITAQIVGRTPVGSFDAEEIIAATKNYWNEWIDAQTTGSITTGVFPGGGTNYNQFQVTIPKAKYTKVGLGDREGVATANVEFECLANSDAGNDEWELIQT